MSYLKTINIQHLTSGTNNIVLDANGNMTCAGTISAATPTGGMRNKIINGDMRIDQRNNGAAAAQYPVDRWRIDATAGASFSHQRNAGSVTPPAGFTNYLGLTSTSTYLPGANTTYLVQQIIEGYNIADFAWGTANAKAVTLSFWVRSSLVGTHSGAITNGAGSRAYPYTFVINSVNTWEYKTIIIPGDTGGSWTTDNTAGLGIRFNLGTGSGTFAAVGDGWQNGNIVGYSSAIQVSATNNATFYITGVQLEIGTVATAFERRPYGLELALCQRYYEKSYDDSVVPGTATTNGQVLGIRSNGAFTLWAKFLVTKRTTPTVTLYSPATGASAKVRNLNSGADETGSTSAVGFSGFNAGGTGATVSEGYSMQWAATADF